MVGSLPRRKDVGVARGKREIGAAVLERESAPFGDNGGSEPGVVGVDERDAVAGFVGYGEVHGIAVVVGGAAVVEDVGCFGWAEEFGAFG